MITLGNIFGRYSGAIKIPDSEATLNWQVYHDDGKAERERVLGELKDRYSRMLPWNMAENMQKMTQAQLEIQKTKPFVNFYIR
jgi:hypothetical protein